jgi:hypothetical protein
MSLFKWMWRWLHDPLLGYAWASMKPDGITMPRKGS